MKKYDIEAIIKTLNILKWCYSFMNKTFIEELKKQDSLLKKEKDARKNIEILTTETIIEVKKQFSKKTGILGKLK